MSSISSLLLSLNNASPENVPKIVEQLTDNLNSENWTAKDLSDFYTKLLTMIERGPPLLQRAACPALLKIFQKEVPPNFYSMIVSPLNSFLSAKKSNREESINFSKKLIDEISPETFWNNFSRNFSSSVVTLRESSATLLLYTINTYNSFQVRNFINSLLPLLKETSSDIRNIAFQIFHVLYERKPKDITKLITNHFNSEANVILNKIGAQQSSAGIHSGRKANLSTSTTLNNTGGFPGISQNQTPEEIERETIAEFENPYPDIAPITSPCAFSDWEKQLMRNSNSNWEVRRDTLLVILAHSRAISENQQKLHFAKELKSISTSFLSCLRDARSSLMKCACLCFVGIAKAIGPALDVCSDTYIPEVIGLTTHGTQIISLSAELCIEGFVSYVFGKKTAKVLEDQLNAQAFQVRATSIKSIFIALQKWPQNLTGSFVRLLASKKNDSNEIVRNLVADVIYNENEDVVSIRSSRSTNQRPMEHYESSEIPDEAGSMVNIVKHQQKGEESSNIVSPPDLEQLINSMDAQKITDYLIKEKPNIISTLSQIIDVIIANICDDSEYVGAQNLLEELCAHYTRHLYPYIQTILHELPPNEDHGMPCLQCLGKAFGNIVISKLLLRSSAPLSYCFKFAVQSANEEPNDLDFLDFVIKQIVIMKLYEEFHIEVVAFLKIINSADPLRCEGLIGSFQPEQRDEILTDIQKELPHIYLAYHKSEGNPLIDSITAEMNKVKVGNEPDIQLITKILSDPNSYDNSSIILTIALIRESPTFNSDYVKLLIPLTKEIKDTALQGSIHRAFQKRLNNHPLTASLITESFVPSPLCIMMLGESLHSCSKEDGEKALLAIHDQLLETLKDITIKYSTLSLIATACTLYSNEYKTFLGELDEVNSRLLENMVKQKTDVNAK